MKTHDCFSADDLRQYACCVCSEEQAKQIESHLEQCDSCQSGFAKLVDSGARPRFLQWYEHNQSTLAEDGENSGVVRADEAKVIDEIRSAQVRSLPDTIGQYRVTGFLGGGGMGVVYAAWDELLKRPVALKLLQRQNEKSSRSMRMLQEAAALGRLSHPNIVSIYELLTHQSQPVMAMEFVQGVDLAKWLNGRRVEPKAAANLVLKLAGALHYAHGQGVVHRDLKPANVMLEMVSKQSRELGDFSEGQNQNRTLAASATGVDLNVVVPKITDFGLAKLVDENVMTNTGDMLGTPAYMAPEQATGNSHSIGPSADIYALGVILYEMLTGRPPFVSNGPVQTLSLVLNALPLSPRTLNAGVPRDLDTICLKCLEKRPSDRYATMSAFADDLGAFWEGRPVKARPIGAVAQGLRWASRNRSMATLIATCAMLLVAITIGSLYFAAREYTLRAELTRKDYEKEATRIEGLVGKLKSADPAKVTEIIGELNANQQVAAKLLTPLVKSEAKTIDEKRSRLHALLATVAQEKSFVEPLLEEMFTNKIAYVAPIRQQLRPYALELQDRLLAILRDDKADSDKRFRAAMALADYVPTAESDSWTAKDLQFIASHLVGANPEFQPMMRENLRPISKLLFPDLEKIFVPPIRADYDGPITDTHRLGAANAFADYAEDDIATLSKLLTIAKPEQYSVLYPVLAAARDSSMIESYAKLIATLPPAEMGIIERISHGQRRASAAVTLLRLGERERVLPVFDMTDDPEAISQFLVRSVDRGVRAEELLDCLRLVSEAPVDRYPLNTRFALLLAACDRAFEDIPEPQRQWVLDLISDWYRNDPSSGIHSAAGFVLRQWGQFELANQVEQTPVPYSADREWFTLAISAPLKSDVVKPEPLPPKTFYYTFIVFPAGNFQVGTSGIRDLRHIHVKLMNVELAQPFAMLDREITTEELIYFRQEYKKEAMGLPLPGTVKNWYDAVAFCRWLSQCNGIAESDQSYAAPESLDKEQYPRETSLGAEWAPRDWPLELRRGGFRLPTEWEWEIACMDGATTMFSFGNDWTLMGNFEWFLGNSNKAIQHPRLKYPNRRGLFDMHGNLLEWTHNWFAVYKDGDRLMDPHGPEQGILRTLRGGSYSFDAPECKPTLRYSNSPAVAKSVYGFRIALSLPEAEIAPEQVRKE